MLVSIPNGKPGPLRRSDNATHLLKIGVSIPNGKPGPLRRRSPMPAPRQRRSFNPKREARPSQTQAFPLPRYPGLMFQSQTGSQALSDAKRPLPAHDWPDVSIPNGTPGPLRPNLHGHNIARLCSFNPKREARPSQTTNYRTTELQSFNPKREARPSQTTA